MVDRTRGGFRDLSERRALITSLEPLLQTVRDEVETQDNTAGNIEIYYRLTLRNVTLRIISAASVLYDSDTHVQRVSETNTGRVARDLHQASTASTGSTPPLRRSPACSSRLNAE